MPQEITTNETAAPFQLGRAISITDVNDTWLLKQVFLDNGCTISNGASANVEVVMMRSLGTFNHSVADFPDEGYKLSVSENSIKIQAVSKVGVIRATQTLQQLAEGYEGTAAIEAVEITDYPAFKVRGWMHDVGRSFVSTDEIEKEIRLMSQLKKLEVGNIRKVKSLLGILSSTVPYSVDTVKLSSMAEISRTTLLHYLQNLSEARLIQLLYSDVTNVKQLQKPDKIYMENTNTLHALATTHVNEGTEREVFFINQLSEAHVVEYSKTSADFTIDHQYTIEVGGRSKDGKQIAGIANSYIASANEEYVLGNKIPLWLFGFLY